MLTSVQKTRHLPSLKLQTLATLLATAAAVALPQLLHLAGSSLGIGSALGEALLPMHLPILLVGFLAGPYAGAAAGLFSPLVSFCLTGMPRPALLPFMMLELCVYGLCTGLLRARRIPAFLSVLTAQLVGRAVRAAAILTAVYCFESTALPVSVIWSSIVTGLCGIALQWLLIPPILRAVAKFGDR